MIESGVLDLHAGATIGTAIGHNGPFTALVAVVGFVLVVAMFIGLTERGFAS